jgi:hypothetical protein
VVVVVVVVVDRKLCLWIAGVKLVHSKGDKSSSKGRAIPVAIIADIQ